MGSCEEKSVTILYKSSSSIIIKGIEWWNTKLGFIVTVEQEFEVSRIYLQNFKRRFVGPFEVIEKIGSTGIPIELT